MINKKLFKNLIFVLNFLILNSIIFSKPIIKNINQKNNFKELEKIPHSLSDLKKMEIEKLEKFLEYFKFKNDIEMTENVLNFLINNKDQLKSSKYLLELADFYFINKNYEQAALQYDIFCNLYPGSSQYEYSFYQFVISNYKQIISYERAVFAIEKTIKFAEDFLKIAKNNDYINYIKNIVFETRELLIKHEIYVFEQYVKSKKFESAKKRILNFEKNFLSLNNEFLIEEILKELNDFLVKNRNPKTRSFLIRIDCLKKNIKRTSKLDDQILAVNF